MIIKDVKAVVADLPNVTARWSTEWQEWRVAYRGLWPDRAEAMAYYTSDHDDAAHTAKAMQTRYWDDVRETDKTRDQLMIDRAMQRTEETVQ